MNEWKKYYQQLQKEDRPQFIETSISEEESIGDNTEKINVAKLRNVLKFTKSGKAAEPGYISIVLVKHGPDIFLEKLMELQNNCLLRGNVIPNDSTIGFLSSLHKKDEKRYSDNSN